MNEPSERAELPGYPRTETIRCPECGKVQAAQVHFEDWMPFPAYVHDCQACGYTIMESEWELVAREGASTVPDIVRALQENVETLVTCREIDKQSASEPRSRLVVTGPTRLVGELAWRLSLDSTSARFAELRGPA